MKNTSLVGSAKQKLEQLVKSVNRPVAIFDLDGTLFDVSHRTVAILNQFLKQESIQERFPSESKLALQVSSENTKYSLEQTLNAVGISRYSEHSAQFIQLAITYWFKHFFTDELLSADIAYKGAASCVHWFHQQGAQVVYLSGRDVPNMSAGTIESLERYGFPHRGHNVTMMLKPSYGMDDLLFKRQAVETIRSEGTVIATFDNEPANVAMFLEEFPEALSFHFQSAFSREVKMEGPHFYAIAGFDQIGFSDER